MKAFNKQLFLEILERYNAGKASPQEAEYLTAYYNLFETKPDFLQDENEKEIKDAVKLKVDARIELYNTHADLDGTKDEMPEVVKTTPRVGLIIQRYAAAAIILITLGIGAYFITGKNNQKALPAIALQDRVPGGNKAVLTLANGKQIVLDEAGKGEIAQQPGISISNTPEGQIVYTVTGETASAENEIPGRSNTISTPKGGQYQVVLSDGTKVWLNSASAISYPSTFSTQQRLVELRGEAYFEVAKNAKVPFRVKTAVQTVEVLGTHFNINAYDDEPLMKTTLLEGSVSVSAGGEQQMLVPGQQARVNKKGTTIQVGDDVNPDKIVAWKNGVFSFEHDDLKSVMRQISRWYDVDVVYTGPVPEDKFLGEISRNSKLSEVLKILELNNVRFKISGKVITVSGNP